MCGNVFDCVSVVAGEKTAVSYPLGALGLRM